MIRQLPENQAPSLGKLRWTWADSPLASLANSQELPIGALISTGQARVVKKGSGRSIIKAEIDGQQVYIKQFRPTNFIGLFRQWFRQVLGEGRAEKEFRLAPIVRKAGVETIQPIALGERKLFGLLLDSYLITRAVGAGKTLFEFIESRRVGRHVDLPSEFRRRLAVELARLAAQIHLAGVEHRDLHERNIIIQFPQGTDRNLLGTIPFELVLLDLHEVKLRWWLGPRRTRKELGRLGRYFTLRSSAADRLRFFHAYARFRGKKQEALKTLAKRVGTSMIESRADFWRRRDTRPLAKNPRYFVRRSFQSVMTWSKELAERIAFSISNNPTETFDNRLVRWLKVGRATRVAEVMIPEFDDSSSLIYKQYYSKSFLHSLVSVVRPNQAERAFRAGGSLLLRDLPTPRPLLLLHRCVLGIPIESFLLTEKVPQARTLTSYMDDVLPVADEHERRRIVRSLISESARLLHRLHDHRVSHRDLKSSNVLISPTDDLARPQIWLIDLDGVQTWLKLPNRRREQNLTRFYVSFHFNRWLTRADRVRFLKAYLRDKFRDRATWKNLWRTIEHGTECKIRRNASRGRGVV